MHTVCRIPCSIQRKANPYFELYDKNGNYNYDYDIQNNTDKDLGFNIFEERQNTSNESVVNSFHLYLMRSYGSMTNGS